MMRSCIVICTLNGPLYRFEAFLFCQLLTPMVRLVTTSRIVTATGNSWRQSLTVLSFEWPGDHWLPVSLYLCFEFPYLPWMLRCPLCGSKYPVNTCYSGHPSQDLFTRRQDWDVCSNFTFRYRLPAKGYNRSPEPESESKSFFIYVT